MRLCYEASCDGPALCNGVPIHVSDTDDPALALVNTGEDKSLADDRYLAFFRAVSDRCQRPRIFGSAALDLCAVAHGRADVYFQTGIYIWDVAAARLICERAGGRCDVLAGTPSSPTRSASAPAPPGLPSIFAIMLLSIYREGITP